MMDLNLLPSSAKFQAKKTLLKKRIIMFVWLSAGLWLVIVTVTIILWVVAGYNLSNNKKSYERSMNQYKSMIGNATLSQQIKYRAKLVGKVLSERFEYGGSLQSVNSLFSNNVVLDNVEIKGRSVCKIDGKVIRGEDLDEVEKKIIAINNGELESFKTATLKSLSINPDGSFSFGMEVTLK